MKNCTKCFIEKDDSEFKKGRRQCKTCITAYQDEYNKKYYVSNRDKLLLDAKKYLELNDRSFYQKEYYHNNKDRRREYREVNKERYRELRNKWVKMKKESDPIYLIQTRVRKLIGKVIKRNGYSKKSKTQDILGIDFNNFKLYIENLFKDGMSWENFGEWHIDHKIPISWGKTEEEIIKLNHYTNLQPLWAEDNLSKGNKYSN